MCPTDQEEDMDTSPPPYSWYFQCDYGNWHMFEDDHCFPLSSRDTDRYFIANSKKVLDVSSYSCHSRIDFSMMVQTNVRTGGQRKIRRDYINKRCTCLSTSLFFLENVDASRPYQLIPLHKQTHEYQRVADFVQYEGLLSFQTIVSINKIQNLDLLEFYHRKKMQIMRIHGLNEIEERRLFHGTDIKNVDLICKYNFDMRLKRKNGNVYGKGIYFAKYASHANNYSTRSTDPLPQCDGDTPAVDAEPTKIIFVARVITGKSVAGEADFQKPDHGSPENTHYSCVDNILCPNIFVIFDPNQIYPEYVIQYK